MRIVLEEAERAALLGPVDRDVAPHQIGESKARRLRAIEDGLGDRRSKVRQPDHSDNVRSRASVFPGKVAHADVAAALETMIPHCHLFTWSPPDQGQ
jgi:hypothetical protein